MLNDQVWPAGWRFSGSARQGSWWQGELRDHLGQLQANVNQGVLDFTLGASFWPLANLRQLDEQQWLQRNWQAEWQHALDTLERLALCRTLLSAPGPVVELAAGPGGGNLAPLLHLKPDCELLINDLEPRLLQRWGELLERMLPSHRVTLAAFDICDMPFRTSSIGCISSVGGLGSIQGDPLAVLRECARVLMPGGLLVAVELSLTDETVAALPTELLELWANSPWLLRRWSELVQQAGLVVVSDQVTAVALGPDDGLWQDAAQFGIQPQAERHYLTLSK